MRCLHGSVDTTAAPCSSCGRCAMAATASACRACCAGRSSTAAACACCAVRRMHASAAPAATWHGFMATSQTPVHRHHTRPVGSCEGACLELSSDPRPRARRATAATAAAAAATAVAATTREIEREEAGRRRRLPRAGRHSAPSAPPTVPMRLCAWAAGAMAAAAASPGLGEALTRSASWAARPNFARQPSLHHWADNMGRLSNLSMHGQAFKRTIRPTNSYIGMHVPRHMTQQHGLTCMHAAFMTHTCKRACYSPHWAIRACDLIAFAPQPCCSVARRPMRCCTSGVSTRCSYLLCPCGALRTVKWPAYLNAPCALLGVLCTLVAPSEPCKAALRMGHAVGAATTMSTNRLP